MAIQPKVILFDIGNVVIDADEAITCKLLRDLGVPKERARLFFSNNDYLEFSRGNISGQDFYRALVNEHLKTPLTYEQVVNAHNQHIYGINKGVLQIVQNLPKERVSFATDTNEWQTAKEKELINLRDYGKYIFRSHELHKLKVDDGFYNEVLKSFGVNSIEILLIDDSPEKVNAAKALGLQGLVYKNPTQLNESLDKLSIMSG
jgi:HAD superfamily hydrolase (TIGR01509 family)